MLFTIMEKWYNVGIALLLCIVTSSTRNENNGWCSPYDTFCLFSEGTETSVSNLSEAQFKCSEIKNDSWPVELGDERIKEVFIEFIHNYSISNVILNADNRNGTWYWIKSNTSVQIVFNVKDSIMVYNKSGIYSNFSVVCMTDCWAKWTDISETIMCDPGCYRHLPIYTPEKCKEFCEKNIFCSSIDWTYAYQFHGCWANKCPYDSSKLFVRDDTSHHVIDRTVKSVQRCIGENFLPYSTSSEPSNQAAKFAAISVPILIIICFITVALIKFVKKRKKVNERTNENAYPRNVSSSTASMPHSQDNRYEELKIEIKENSHIYTHLSLQSYANVSVA